MLVDADVGLRNLDIVLGLEARVRHHVLDVLEGVATLDDALVTDKRVPTLRLLAAAQTREKDDVDTQAFRDLIGSLRERFDYVLIDCPAGIEKGFANAIVGADEAIIVCTPEVSAVRDADRVVGLLGDERSVKLIVNRLRPAMVRKGKMLSVDDVNGILRLPLLGVIADAPDVIIVDQPRRAGRARPRLADRRGVPRDRAAHHRDADHGARDPARDVVLRKALRGPPLVFEFIQRFFGKPSSSATAKERLRLVLLSDHLSLAPDVVESLRHDLIEVISRYVDVDAANCDVTFEQRENRSRCSPTSRSSACARARRRHRRHRRRPLRPSRDPDLPPSLDPAARDGNRSPPSRKPPRRSPPSPSPMPQPAPSGQPRPLAQEAPQGRALAPTRRRRRRERGARASRRRSAAVERPWYTRFSWPLAIAPILITMLGIVFIRSGGAARAVRGRRVAQADRLRARSGSG